MFLSTISCLTPCTGAHYGSVRSYPCAEFRGLLLALFPQQWLDAPWVHQALDPQRCKKGCPLWVTHEAVFRETFWLGILTLEGVDLGYLLLWN